MLPGEHRAQPFGVVQGAQQVYAGHAFGAGEPDGFGAGRQDEGVVGHGPLGGVEEVVAGAHAQGLAAQPQGDAERLEVDVEGGPLGRAEQDGLGQRGAVVRLVRLRADQGHRAGEALFPQGDRRLHARHPGAHHDHTALRVRRRPLSPFPRLLTHLITIDTPVFHRSVPVPGELRDAPGRTGSPTRALCRGLGWPTQGTRGSPDAPG